MKAVQDSDTTSSAAKPIRWLIGWGATALVYLWTLTIGQTVGSAILGSLALSQIPDVLGPALLKVLILLPFGLLAVGPAVAIAFAAVLFAGVRHRQEFAVGGLVAGVAHAAGPIAIDGGITPDGSGRVVAYVVAGPLAAIILHHIVQPVLPTK